MKIGDLVKYKEIIGLILDPDPWDDGNHTEIYWVDEEEPRGTIVSVWENIDFEVINEEI